MEIKLLNSVDFLKTRATDTTWVFLVEEEEGNLFSQPNLLTLHSFGSQVEINSVLFGWKKLRKGRPTLATELISEDHWHAQETADSTGRAPSALAPRIQDLVLTWSIRRPWPSLFDVQTKHDPLSHGHRCLSACLPGGHGSLQHPLMLWNRVGRRWVEDPREKADWICKHQTEVMIHYFSSGLGGSLGYAEWNLPSFFSEPTSTLEDLNRVIAYWGWDIARSRPKRM